MNNEQELIALKEENKRLIANLNQLAFLFKNIRGCSQYEFEARMVSIETILSPIILNNAIREDERKRCAQICRDAGAYKDDIETYYDCAEAILSATDTSS